MSDYFIPLEIARMRQQEMSQQAEAERLYRQLKGNRAGLLRQVGRRLLAAVRQLKIHPQSSSVMPSCREV